MSTKIAQMAGLKLIEGYSSSSDDDDDDVSRPETVDKKINLNSLPLPKFAPVGTGVEHYETIVDNPEEHDGRVRSFKHERGNWATLVYADYKPSEALQSWMTSVNTIIPAGTLILNDSHLSFSRTLILKYHWIESFVESLRDLTRSTPKFNLQITNVKIYCNEGRTRTFLGLECQCLDQTVTHYMTSLNKLLSEYQLPPFYEDASYHISFLWLLGDKEEDLKKLIPTLNESLFDILSKHFENSYINIEHIHCKVGNKLYKWPLR
ncbi:U6 snRNA phosphodiesterase [Diachasma alloeum]|uniref:U6 snRNA phosphodiesterase n=1 Tax=Diachasma alloeum TaxID=454923 RepID=UPI000738178A|nr:U6 snRNA phosphodiesterase [Diachasma alloeum]